MLRIVIMLAAGYLLFMVGAGFGYLRLPPIPQIVESAKVLRDKLGATSLLASRLHWVEKQPDPTDGAAMLVPERMAPGLTIVQGFDPEGAFVELLEPDGTLVHRWPTDFQRYWQEPKHIQPEARWPKAARDYFIQGFLVHPDGSMVLPYSVLGGVKIDHCGEAEWRLDETVHHAVTTDRAGGYWMPSQIPAAEVEEKYLPTSGRSNLEGRVLAWGNWTGNTILRVGPDGAPLQEFFPLEKMLEAGLERVVYDGVLRDSGDPFHINEVEVVTPPLAARIDGVEAGDLLVSIRNISALVIFDAEDGRVLWHAQGPWIEQHDPDITEDGLIEIFSNKPYRMEAVIGVGSEILRYDPATDETELLFPAGEEDRFQTSVMGAHQGLPNGNRLIIESIKGRVIEVAPDGTVVWKYIRRWDDEYAALITLAERVPPDFFTIEDWSCPQS